MKYYHLIVGSERALPFKRDSMLSFSFLKVTQSGFGKNAFPATDITCRTILCIFRPCFSDRQIDVQFWHLAQTFGRQSDIHVVISFIKDAYATANASRSTLSRDGWSSLRKHSISGLSMRAGICRKTSLTPQSDRASAIYWVICQLI